MEAETPHDLLAGERLDATLLEVPRRAEGGASGRAARGAVLAVLWGKKQDILLSSFEDERNLFEVIKNVLLHKSQNY